VTNVLDFEAYRKRQPKILLRNQVDPARNGAYSTDLNAYREQRQKENRERDPRTSYEDAWSKMTEQQKTSEGQVRAQERTRTMRPTPAFANYKWTYPIYSVTIPKHKLTFRKDDDEPRDPTT
jgi:hypothetical protein